jgi:hypothetical protein
MLEKPHDMHNNSINLLIHFPVKLRAYIDDMVCIYMLRTSS